MATETQKLGVGGLLLVVGTVIILGVTTFSGTISYALSGAATLLMAAGSLIVGLSEDGAGV